MKRILSQRIGALILAMAISMSLVSPCVSYAVEKGCPLQEHQHTSECYKLPNKRKLNCGVIAHSHGPECYDGEGTLVCGYSDKIIHTHDKNCYDEDGNLVCDLPEYETHTHTKDCYEESRVLVCQEVVLPPPHEHTESCYKNQEKCVCGQEDDETHIHTDKCFQMEKVLVCTEDEIAQSHIHTDACYATHLTLVCGKNDLVPHTHTADCRDMNGWYICGMLETVDHQHDDFCFTMEEGGVSEIPLCGMEEHIHSDICQGKKENDFEFDNNKLDNEEENSDFSSDNELNSANEDFSFDMYEPSDFSQPNVFAKNDETGIDVQWGSVVNDSVFESDISGIDGVTRMWDVSRSTLRYIKIPITINLSGTYLEDSMKIEIPLNLVDIGRNGFIPTCTAEEGTNLGWRIEKNALSNKIILTNDESSGSASHGSIAVSYYFDCWNTLSDVTFTIPYTITKGDGQQISSSLQGIIHTGYDVKIGTYDKFQYFNGFAGVDRDTDYIQRWNPVYEIYFGLTQDAFERDKNQYVYDIAAYLIRPEGQQPYDIGVEFIPGRYPLDGEYGSTGPILEYGPDDNLGNEGELVGAVYMMDSHNNPDKLCVKVGEFEFETLNSSSLPHLAPGNSITQTYNKYNFTINNADLMIQDANEGDHLAVVSSNLSDQTDNKQYTLYFLVRYPKDNVTIGTNGKLMNSNLSLTHKGVDSLDKPNTWVNSFATSCLYNDANGTASGDEGYHYATHVRNLVESNTGLNSLLFGVPTTIDLSADFFCLNEARNGFDPYADAKDLNRYRMEAMVDLLYLSNVNDEGRTQLGEGDYCLSGYKLSLVDANGNSTKDPDGTLYTSWYDFTIPDWAYDAEIEIYGSTSMTGNGTNDWKLLDTVPASRVWARNADRDFKFNYTKIEDPNIVRLKVVYDSRLTAALRIGYQVKLLSDGNNVTKALKKVESNANLDELGLTSWLNYAGYSYPDSGDMTIRNVDLQFRIDAIVDKDQTINQARLYDTQNPLPGYEGLSPTAPSGTTGYTCRNCAEVKLRRSEDAAGMIVSQVLYDEFGVVGNKDSSALTDTYCRKTDVSNVKEVVYSITGVITNKAKTLDELQTRRAMDEGFNTPYTAMRQRYYVLLPEGLKLNEEVRSDNNQSSTTKFLSPYSTYYAYGSEKCVRSGWINTLPSDTNVPGLKLIDDWNVGIRDMGWSLKNGNGYDDGDVILVDKRIVGNRQLIVMDRIVNQDDGEGIFDLWGSNRTNFWGRGLSFSAIPVNPNESLPAGTYDTQFLCQFLDDKGNPIPIECSGPVSNTAKDAFSSQVISNLIDPVLDTRNDQTLLSISHGFTNKSDSNISISKIAVKSGSSNSTGSYGSDAAIKPGDPYSYELTYEITSGSSNNVVLWSNIEQYERNFSKSEWEGSVCGVNLKGNQNVTVYVRKESYNPNDYVGKANAGWLTDNAHGWEIVNNPSTYEDWEKVKAIAFSFSESFSASGKKSASVYIDMIAPEEDNIKKIPKQKVYTTYSELIFSDTHNGQPGCAVTKAVQVQLEIEKPIEAIFPNTGGTGNGLYAVGGTLLIVMPFVLMTAKKKKSF